MKITRGNTHEFIGMTITCRDDNNFNINIWPCLEATTNEFGKETLEESAPERSDVFRVNENAPRVDETRRKLFHHLVCRLTCCTGRRIKYLETTTSFVTKRSNSCNDHDHCKLRHLIHYAHVTRDLESSIGV